MALESIKSAMFQRLQELFEVAAVDEMAGDTAAYMEKLETIGRVAEILGMPTEITAVTINLKDEQ